MWVPAGGPGARTCGSLGGLGARPPTPATAVFSSKPPNLGRPRSPRPPAARGGGPGPPSPAPRRRRRGRGRASAGARGRGGRGEEVRGEGGVAAATSAARGDFCHRQAPRSHWQRSHRQRSHRGRRAGSGRSHEAPAEPVPPAATRPGVAGTAGAAGAALHRGARHHRLRPAPPRRHRPAAPGAGSTRQHHGKTGPHPAPAAAPLPLPLPLPPQRARQVPGPDALPGAAGGDAAEGRARQERHPANLGQRELGAGGLHPPSLPHRHRPGVRAGAAAGAGGGEPSLPRHPPARFLGHLQQLDVEDVDGHGVGEQALPQRQLRDEGRPRRLPQPGLPGAPLPGAPQAELHDGLHLPQHGAAAQQGLQVVRAPRGLPQQHLPALLRRARLRLLRGPGQQNLRRGPNFARHQHGGFLRGHLPARAGHRRHQQPLGRLQHVPDQVREVPVLPAGDGPSLPALGPAADLAPVPGGEGGLPLAAAGGPSRAGAAGHRSVP